MKPFTLLLILIGLITGLVPPTSSFAASSSTISLRSINYPTHYMRYRSGVVEISPIQTEVDRQGASFRLVPGLADPAHISFESIEYPGRYLRHEFGQIQLHAYTDNTLFRNDATFKKVPGLQAV